MLLTPRFISDKPHGIDKFDGGSQILLSKAIVQHILRNDDVRSEESLPRIVGIEGTWGAGKSNVVKMVEKELSDVRPKQYFFFEYDAWGNQEDLQRRSLLEQLTTKLVRGNILKGKTEITIKGGGTKNVTWQEKLKLLLARKTETTSETYPRISNGMIAGALTTILTSISSLVGLLLADSCGWFSLLIAFFPIIITLVIWSLAAWNNKEYRNLSYIFAIYNDKINKETQFEYISEDEPSVVEFKKWMQDVSDNLNKKICQKLVIVFDNMDRLPAEKVKQLWSSIHTFFAESGFDNVWVLIPYDEKHLSCAFGEGNDDSLKLTRYFINKTFPITFYVPKPVITDYKGIFSKLFVEAFGSGHKEEELINRIYRLNNVVPNIRDIIIFINNIVSLYFVWDEQIKLTNMAIYLLHKDEIHKDPIKEILSCNYIKQEKSIIDESEDFKSEIAAITYGVNKEIARQIPLMDYIIHCVDATEGYDINLYAETDSNFDTILKEVILDVDPAKNINLIRCLSKLKKSNDNIKFVWEIIANRLLREPVNEQVLPEEFELTLPHLSKDYCQQLVNKLCEAWRNLENFNGANYIKCLNSLDLIQGVDFEIPRPILHVKPDAFIDAIGVSMNSYKDYNLIADPQLVDKYIAEKIPNEMRFANIVCKLYDDQFCTFEQTNNKLIEVIKGKVIDINNVWSICQMFRHINTGVVPQIIEEPVLQTLLPELTNSGKTEIEDGYIDLMAISIAKHRSIVIEDQYVDKVASIIDSYIEYGDMMLNGLTWNNFSVNKIVKYMIEHNLGKNLDLDIIIPKLIDIKNHYSVKESDLLTNLNKWAAEYEISINPENIQDLIPNAQVFNYSSVIHNNLTCKINVFAIEALSNRTAQQFISTEKNYASDYWHQMLLALINDDSMQTKPQCIIEYAGYLYKQLATGVKSIRNDSYYLTIAQSVEPSLISHVFSDIRDSICNGNSNITLEIFEFCENNLVQYGELNDRATNVVDRILKPIIKSEKVKNRILEHKLFYISLFSKAGAIEDFKHQVKLCWSTESELLNLLGITVEENDEI